VHAVREKLLIFKVRPKNKAVMDNELKEMLRRVLANQAAIFRKLDVIERSLPDTRMPLGTKSITKALKKESDKLIDLISES
jgi:hypothetical protein